MNLEKQICLTGILKSENQATDKVSNGDLGWKDHCKYMLENHLIKLILKYSLIKACQKSF